MRAMPCVLCLSEGHCTHFCSSPVPRPAVFGCYLSLKGLSLVFKGEEGGQDATCVVIQPVFHMYQVLRFLGRGPCASRPLSQPLR